MFTRGYAHDMSHLKPPDTVFFQPAGCEASSEAEAKSLHHDLRRAEDADGLIQSGGGPVKSKSPSVGVDITRMGHVRNSHFMFGINNNHP